MIRAIALLACLVSLPAAADEVPELFLESYALESSYRYEAALARVSEVPAAGEDAYLVHLRSGWLLYLLGRYQESVTAYSAATDVQPSVEARLGLTLPLVSLRRWSDVEALCLQVLEEAPGNYTAMSRLAYARFNQGRYAESAAAYEAVLAQYPGDLEMRAGLGWSRLRQGDTAAAREAFAAVLRYSPDHASALEGIAACSP